MSFRDWVLGGALLERHLCAHSAAPQTWPKLPLLSTTLHFTKCLLIICAFGISQPLYLCWEESCHFHFADKQPQKQKEKYWPWIRILLESKLKGVWTRPAILILWTQSWLLVSRPQWDKNEVRRTPRTGRGHGSGRIFKVYTELSLNLL